MVFHDQDNDILNDINHLNFELSKYQINQNLLHTEPLIRNEGIYNGIDANTRRGIISRFNFFVKHANIKYKAFIFHKKQYENNYKLEADIVKTFDTFFDNNSKEFNKFEKIILYYDNGQLELSKILNHTMALHFYDYEIRKINPKDYKLFQVADYACTIELINEKIKNKPMSKSETFIFKSIKAFKKEFLKVLRMKIFSLK